MKKLFWILMTISVLLLPVAVLAEGELPAEEAVVTPVATELPVDPFSWEQLATIAGATLATLLIVQLLKLPLDKVWKIPTRLVAYVIALIVMILATHFTAGLTWSNAGLSALNAVIVALSAMGAYELTFRKIDARKPVVVKEKAEEPEKEKEEA